MNFWKWSNGETYYQSPRKYREKESETSLSNNNMNYDSSINAIEQSLAEPTDIIPNHMLSKRETLDNKMSDRELISQRGVNPFSGQTSYVNDVVTRDMFLKPINTTQGRTKNQNKGEDE